MKRKSTLLLFLTLAALLLTGCAMRTVEEMYALPKRSEEYSQLQSAIDRAMVGLEYAAPISGINQQTLQTADLDGDGQEEYLVFASGNWENPLQVLIFKQGKDGTCDLVDIIESNGATFEQVEYVPFDDKPGMEIILGCQVSDQILRSVSVYSLEEGRAQQLLLVGYGRFSACDLDGNGSYELMVLRPGEDQSQLGVSVLYTFRDGKIERSQEVGLSTESTRIRRVQMGKLEDGKQAVFISGAADQDRVLTDILAAKDGALTNISAGQVDQLMDFSAEYYVYPEDIDEDGVLEIPDQMTIRPVSVWRRDAGQAALRWFSLDAAGQETDKLHTFHNFLDGWYLKLNSDWVDRMSMVQGEDVVTFYIWNPDYTEALPLFSVFTFTGNTRNEDAAADGRFLLYRTETALYAAKLEPDAPTYAITRESLTESFRLIRSDWRVN